MGKFLFILSVLSVAGFSNALECYDCAGFVPELPESEGNQIACQEGTFDADKVETIELTNTTYELMCFKSKICLGGIDDIYELTFRALEYRVVNENGVVEFVGVHTSLNDLIDMKEGEEIIEDGTSALDKLIAGYGMNRTDCGTESNSIEYCSEDLCNGATQILTSPIVLLILMISFAVTY